MRFKFNTYQELEGKHAILSASNYHWINYSEERMLEVFDNKMTAAHGTRLHAWACETIKLGLVQPNTTQTINMYVNDCIGYRMQTEVLLYYSQNAFGTADAIDFVKAPEGDHMILRIFDLKNGVIKASFTQLLVYAAFFCLEYKVRPADIEYDLRIYQNDEIHYCEVDPQEIIMIMGVIKDHDKLLKKAREVTL